MEVDGTYWGQIIKKKTYINVQNAKRILGYKM